MSDLIVCDTPDAIEAYRLLSMRAALGLEVKGLKHSRVSVYAMIKREFKLHGSKESVAEQFAELLRKKGVLVEGQKEINYP